jgi:hypothetical protein
MVWIDHRALAVRIKSPFIDVTLITAYAYTEHTDQQKKRNWWKDLTKEINKLPKRTNKVIGIDANGHTGRDPGPGIGSKGEEMWTFNATQLQYMVTETQMTVTNTVDSCKNTGPTLYRRDGKASGRIDFVIMDSKHMNLMCENHGAMKWEEIGRQGAAIDHKPVMIRRKFTLLQETMNKKHKDFFLKQMTTHNKKLTMHYEQYIKSVNNQYRLEQIDTDETVISEIHAMQEWVQAEVQQNINYDSEAHVILAEIDRIMEDACWMFFWEKREKD